MNNPPAAVRDAAAAIAALGAGAAEPVPDKTVVLTFDDAVKSHLTVVAPILAEYGFGATFFVTHRWMDDPTRFMTWDNIAQLHRMGFEIGNHSWTHADFFRPKAAARLAGELALVENARKKNLDAAALNYVDMTLTCVKCHNHVREIRMARFD